MSMLPSSILHSIESFSSCRDRDELSHIMLRAVEVLLGEGASVAVFCRKPDGEVQCKLASGLTAMDPLAVPWVELLDRLLSDQRPHFLVINDRISGAIPLVSSEIASDHLVLAYEIDAPDSAVSVDSVSCLARIYGNQISLLDYSELDTLTHLLNRKTFDETFDRLLNSHAVDAVDEIDKNRRGHPEQDMPAWLGVVDIDHFKRVNDSFGHLFGDEVLLRVGDLMRKTFRGGDRLFRFGGEEFVVILNAESEALAAIGFNRFRTSVESYEFPQVGQVTCSMGFTAVGAGDVATDVVGRADEALYYAKDNGRNQVCSYEFLLAEGLIAAPTVVEAPVSDFDIDALFG